MLEEEWASSELDERGGSTELCAEGAGVAGELLGGAEALLPFLVLSRMRPLYLMKGLSFKRLEVHLSRWALSSVSCIRIISAHRY